MKELKTKDKRKYMREYMRNRYHNDPEFRQRMISMNSDYQRRKKKE